MDAALGGAGGPGGGGIDSVLLANLSFNSTTPGAENLHVGAGSAAIDVEDDRVPHAGTLRVGIDALETVPHGPGRGLGTRERRGVIEVLDGEGAATRIVSARDVAEVTVSMATRPGNSSTPTSTLPTSMANSASASSTMDE